LIENNLKEISQRIVNITPVDWEIDSSSDDTVLYVRRKNERPMKKSDIIFFENAATDIAKLVIEIKQLREVNRALKRQIIGQEFEKDIRFV
jgi:hypothetical protein